MTPLGDAALADDFAAVEEFFAEHELPELDPNHRWVAALARGILTCSKSPDPDATLAEIHDGLTELAAELKPIDRADYRVALSDAQLGTLREMFPGGVCDYSRPGVGKRSPQTWLTYPRPGSAQQLAGR